MAIIYLLLFLGSCICFGAAIARGERWNFFVALGLLLFVAEFALRALVALVEV